MERCWNEATGSYYFYAGSARRNRLEERTRCNYQVSFSAAKWSDWPPSTNQRRLLLGGRGGIDLSSVFLFSLLHDYLWTHPSLDVQMDSQWKSLESSRIRYGGKT